MAKVGPNDSVGLDPSRTLEVTDPVTGISYLFSGNQRIVKPQDSGTVTAVISALNSFLLN